MVNTILNQPIFHRVSTDRPNRENSQLVASLEGDRSPTPTGKTLPHSNPVNRFQKAGARDGTKERC